MIRRIRRKQRRIIHGLRQRAIERFGLRSTYPKTILNGIPKSGTHLLRRCLVLLPGMNDLHINMNIPSGVTELSTKLARVYRGSFIYGHIIFTREYFDIIRSLDFSMLVMIRDPRDIAVSLLHWITYKHKNHRLRKYFLDLEDDDQRLMKIIQGIDPLVVGARGGLENINDFISAYLPWGSYGNPLVRFENLIGIAGGGSHDLQINEIQRIASYLNIYLKNNEIKNIADRVFNKDSRTFRKGKIGDWANHFSQAHKEAFREIAGQLLIDMGYETGLDW